MALPIKEIDALLAKSKKLPPSQMQEQTFMEIAGYPNYENVCSNILQFYFQPTNEHGFGTLLLDTLATLIKEELVIGGQVIDVRREEITDNNNRIDLVIESDDYVLGIENKIFAPLDNPLCDYAKHLEYLSKGHKKVYKVLLSLRPQPSSALKCFCPITYEAFFQKLIEDTGSYFLTAREPYVTFLRDFIQTIQNLQRSTAMDQERLAYFKDNQEDIAKLLAEVEKLREDMLGKVKQLKAVTTDLSKSIDLDKSIKLEVGVWQPLKAKDLAGVTWYKYKFSESSWLQLDVFITPSGWWMQFFNKSGCSLLQVKLELEARGIKVEYNTSKSRLIYKGEESSFPYETEIEIVRTWTLKMLQRLATEPKSLLGK